MKISNARTTLVNTCLLLTAMAVVGVLAKPLPGDGGAAKTAAPRSDARELAARTAPYAADPDHLWNRLHRALFVRTGPDGQEHVHSTDPLLYRGGTFLLEGEPHRRALALLDELLAAGALVAPRDRVIDDPLKRLVFQRDLWGAFDYVAWIPDDWVIHSRHEPAALALRTRLATAIGRLALDDRELGTLPDNYALAVKSKEYAAEHDPQHPERPFLPADLFDPAGPWVRFHQTTYKPMTEQHFDGAGGRAAHIVFLRLPEGRAATERYLSELRRDAIKQFPPGTMVAMVRRALAVDRVAKVRVTPLTELVQIRVYRRIPDDPRANFHDDSGAQDAYEFVLDRQSLFAGRHGLRAVTPDELEEPLGSPPFARNEGADPFERPVNRRTGPPGKQLKTCIQCHQAPGMHSMLSMQRGLKEERGEIFRTYRWDVEMSYTVTAKTQQFKWGLLQGLLEAKR